MQDNNDEFTKSNNELGEFINFGFFGEDAKELTNKFSKISDSEYYASVLDMWLDGDQYGKDNIKDYLKVFMKIMGDAFEKNYEKTSDEILFFIKGDKSGTKKESITAYKEFLLNHRMCWDEIMELSKNKTNRIIATKSANLIINDYSKGIEFVSKIYSLINILFCITDKRKINMVNINKKTLYEKCNNIKNRQDKEYDILIDCVDRNIRNSQSHLNASYDFDRGIYLFRIFMKNKWVNYEVTARDMILNIYPKVGWCVQGFIYAICMVIIIYNDRKKGLEYISKIFKQ